MKQIEIVDAVQSLIGGDARTRAKIQKLFPVGLRFFLTRYPSYDLAIEWDGTADGADYIWLPEDFQWTLRVWTSLREEPVTVLSPTEFADLKATDYSGNKIYCTPMRTRRGKRKLQFIDDIGSGTTVYIWYMQKAEIISLDMVPDYYADVMIAWLRKQLAQSDTPEYIRAKSDLKEARDDLQAMKQANPAAEIVGRIPSNWRR